MPSSACVPPLDDCPSDATAIGEHPYLPLDLAESLEERARLLDEGSGRARAFEIALDFVHERHPRCEAAFISGSYAKHAATALSDVDIFVIDARCTTPLREQRVYKGYALQVAIMDRSIPERLLEFDLGSSMISYLPALAAAVPIAGDAQFVRDLQQRAATALETRPARWPDSKIARARMAVINNYLKLFHDLDRFDRFTLCTKLVRSVAKYLQARGGMWITDELKYEPSLKADSVYGLVVDAVPTALVGDHSALIKAVHAVLVLDEELRWEIPDVRLVPFFN